MLNVFFDDGSRLTDEQWASLTQQLRIPPRRVIETTIVFNGEAVR